jgi:hypothetical protein
MMTAKTIVRWYGKAFNRRMMERLRSNKRTRLHKNNMLISLVGRRSGNPYTFPVNYCITPEGTYVVSSEANWRHNFTQGTNVELLVCGERISGHGVTIADDRQKRERLGRMLTGIGWLFFAKSLTVIEITAA